MDAGGIDTAAAALVAVFIWVVVNWSHHHRFGQMLHALERIARALENLELELETEAAPAPYDQDQEAGADPT